MQVKVASCAEFSKTLPVEGNCSVPHTTTSAVKTTGNTVH